METPTRRDVLKGVGAAAGSIALGPKLVSAEPASSRYIVDVGDRASTIDTDRVENAGLTVIHDLEEIGYLVVEGELDVDLDGDETVTLGVDEAIHVPPRQSRQLVNRGDERVKVVAVGAGRR